MTHHILEASHRLGVTRVVQGSSLTVQLADLERPDFCEDDSVDPQSVYACSKLTCEHLGQYYTRKKGLPVYSLRIGQPYPVPTHPAEEWRSSKRVRSIFITMSDLAQGIAAAVTTDRPPGVYNLVSDSDNPRVNLRRASEMGYTPLNKFTAEGIWSRDTPEAPWHLETPVL